MSLTLDVFPNILDHIHSTSDLFNLCLSSRSIAYYSRSRLYDGTLFSATVSGVRPNDRRRSKLQYAKLLRVLSRHPELACRVRTFVVPYISLPHERFDELWDAAFVKCSDIEEFRWCSRLPVPHSLIDGLSMKRRLRFLSISAYSISSPRQINALARRHSLEELSLLAPDSGLRPILVPWINSMSGTLRRLHIDGSSWLDDCLFKYIRLPNLRALTLHNCPLLTAGGVLPLLRSATNLESLHLGPAKVRVAELVFPKDRMPPPAFLRLQKISIYWESSLAFWLHVQTLLACSPIEAFHIIRTSASGENIGTPYHGTGSLSAALPLPHALPSTNAMVDIAALTLNDADLRSMSNARNIRGAVPSLFAIITRLGLGLQFLAREAGPQDLNNLFDPSVVDVTFIRRFAALHNTTLRQFWTVGIRCSDIAIKDLRKRCEKLERVRINGVDEYRMVQKFLPPVKDNPRASKNVWSWWRTPSQLG